MRNFRRLPMPGMTGTPVADNVPGDGVTHMMTITTDGAQLEPVFPHYGEDPDEDKHGYRLYRPGGIQGQLKRAGRP